jgi:hypothetical protein
MTTRLGGYRPLPKNKEDLFFAQALLRLQTQFRQAGKCTLVNLGFHYTQQAYLSRIRTNGLLTKADREARNITTKKCNGSHHGDGIYTCHDHLEGVKGLYGNVGILVARLQGERSVDCTMVENRHIVVLKHFTQCLPLVQFPRWMIGSPILLDVQKADKTTWKSEFWCGQKRSVITTTKSWLEFGCLCEQHSGPLV